MKKRTQPADRHRDAARAPDAHPAQTGAGGLGYLVPPDEEADGKSGQSGSRDVASRNKMRPPGGDVMATRKGRT